MATSSNLHPPAHHSGFSLIEILVAFSIMALSLGVLLRIFGGSGQIVRTTDDYARAIIVAESVLSTAGIETSLQPGETSGDFDQEHRWTLRVTPYPVDESQTGAFNLPFKPYWVELSVEWGQPGERRTFELQTLRLIQANPTQPFGGVPQS